MPRLTAEQLEAMELLESIANDPEFRRHLLRLWLAAHRFASLEQELRQRIGTAR